MSVYLLSLTWRARMPDVAERVRNTRKMVLLRLADIANDEGGSIFPSVAKIAAECSLADRTVQYVLRELTELGYLVEEKPGGAGQKSTTHYRIVVGKLLTDVADREAETRAQALHPSEGSRVQPLHPSDGVKGATEDALGCNGQQFRVHPLHPTHQEPPKNQHTQGAREASPSAGQVGAGGDGDGKTPPGFDDFTAAMPRRDGPNPPEPARRAWDAALAEGHDPVDIWCGALAYQAWAVREGHAGTRFVCTWATFLAERRWTDAAMRDAAEPGSGVGERRSPAVALPRETDRDAGAWRRVCGRVQARVGVAAARTYLRPTSWQGVVDGRALVVCVDERQRDWILAHAHDEAMARLVDEDLGVAALDLIPVAAWIARPAAAE